MIADVSFLLIEETGYAEILPKKQSRGTRSIVTLYHFRSCNESMSVRIFSGDLKLQERCKQYLSINLFIAIGFFYKLMDNVCFVVHVFLYSDGVILKYLKKIFLKLFKDWKPVRSLISETGSVLFCKRSAACFIF